MATTSLTNVNNGKTFWGEQPEKPSVLGRCPGVHLQKTRHFMFLGGVCGSGVVVLQVVVSM